MFNVSSNLALRDVWEHMVISRADADFLVFVDVDESAAQTYTYAEFDKLVNQTANMLIELGVKQGDKAAVYLPNSVEHVECILALLKIGAVYVPLNSRYTNREMCGIIADSKAKILITSEFLETECCAGYHLTQLLVDDKCSLGYNQRRCLYPSTPPNSIKLQGSDIAEIIYTSGTNSYPKGVLMTNANLIFSGWYVNWQLAMTEEDRYFSSMPISHVNLQLSALFPTITCGCTFLLTSRYSAKRFWCHVRKYEATLVQSMSMIAKTMMCQPVDAEEKNHRVRLVHYFLPISDNEKVQFEERFNVKLLNNYGSTETLVGVITDSPYGLARWPSIGLAGFGYDARIMREGKECSVGEIGEIQIRGIPGISLMAGYYGMPEETSKVLDEEGWYSTRDLGYQDNDGFFYFAGRDADFIKRSGENVSALEVEKILSDCPGVSEVAVVRVPDEIRDEAVKAFVVASDPTLNEATVIKYASAHLADFKVPSIVEFLDALPKGEYGKVQKKLLR